jgi:cellulose synthase operon protein C
MTASCDLVHEFVDGELALDERAAFFAHLEHCPRCNERVEALLHLEASFEEVMQRKAASPRITARRVWLGSGLAAAAAVVMLLVGTWSARETARRRQIAPLALARSERRPIEARVGPPEMDLYGRYDPQLGAGRDGPPSYKELAELERHGQRFLAARLLQLGDLRGAGAVLDRAREDRTMDNERAVLALMEARPADALTYLPRGGEDRSTSEQMLWNRALALRDLGLPHAAARAFQVVAERKGQGWSKEADDLARAIASDAGRWQARFDQAMEEGRALVREQKPPSPSTLAGQRDFVRLFLYDAVRSARSRGEVQRLLPVAAALDRSYGGEVLTRYVRRIAGADFRRRRPLVDRYRAYASVRWVNLDPVGTHALLADLRRAGQYDMLIGALLATGTALDDVQEFARLARAQNDPWFSIAVDEVLAEDPALPLPEREALLRRAIREATDSKLDLRRTRLEKPLIAILLQQHRSQEASGLLSELRARARRLDDVTVERLALQNLVIVAHLRRQRALLQAYADEVLLLPGYPCVNRRQVAILLAQDAVLAGELETTRERLKVIPSCSDAQERDVEVATIYSELARRGGATDGKVLHDYLATGAPALGKVERILASVLEQRAFVSRSPAAREALARAVALLEPLPDNDEMRNLARSFAYRALVFQASRIEALVPRSTSSCVSARRNCPRGVPSPSAPNPDGSAWWRGLPEASSWAGQSRSMAR